MVWIFKAKKHQHQVVFEDEHHGSAAGDGKVKFNFHFYDTMLTVSSGVLDLRGILSQFFGSTHNQGLLSIFKVQSYFERYPQVLWLVIHYWIVGNFENMTIV